MRSYWLRKWTVCAQYSHEHLTREVYYNAVAIVVVGLNAEYVQGSLISNSVSILNCILAMKARVSIVKTCSTYLCDFLPSETLMFRDWYRLPGDTNELVSAILAAQSNTIVVNQSGTPVEMPWVDGTSALLQAFYGGNNVGEGLADVLFGKYNPSAKLPLSFP